MALNIKFPTLSKLAELMSRELRELKLVALMIDGVHLLIAAIPPSTIFHRSTTKGFSKQKV